MIKVWAIPDNHHRSLHTRVTSFDYSIGQAINTFGRRLEGELGRRELRHLLLCQKKQRTRKILGMKHDDTIRKNVMDEILWDPQLTPIASQIGVIVKNEVVTLSGTVDYYGQKLAAEQAAKRVKDVKVVAVDIKVKSAGFSDTTSDTVIADAVRNALLWHSAVNEDKINIKVEDGWITLDGTVDWEFERKAAQRAVEHLRGVMGVINRITITPRKIDAPEIKKKIRAAFHRHATVDSSKVHVATQGDVVTLTGNVRSWTERRDAEAVAWSMPGVTTVENKLEVESAVFAD